MPARAVRVASLLAKASKAGIAYPARLPFSTSPVHFDKDTTGSPETFPSTPSSSPRPSQADDSFSPLPPALSGSSHPASVLAQRVGEFLSDQSSSSSQSSHPPPFPPSSYPFISQSISTNLPSPSDALKPAYMRDTLLPSYTPAPRKNKGVHSSKLRARGHTPHEHQRIDSVLQGIFAQLDKDDALGPYTHTSRDLYGSPRRPTLYGIPGVVGRSRGPMSRLLDREVGEEDPEVTEQLEALKEEMSMCNTDMEILAWAKERILTPLPSSKAQNSSPVHDHTKSDITSSAIHIDSTPQSNTSDSMIDVDTNLDIQETLTYPKVYPLILGQLLRTIRIHYNNPYLALAIFQHAQTVSVESYLSGCLAPAYNEVLRIRWESFLDLWGLEHGVREMEVNGVAWDRGTFDIVNGVVEQISRELLDPAGLARWGNEAAKVVARLEKRVQADVRNEAFIQSDKMKARARTRERYEREHSVQRTVQRTV
ncbi:hypothetical protein TREMEDRAFT_74679 [Tremella mesenterica DSM 1558]|uniref:uncharacterized protein n=1 Tax=Tremella mesenterica (strain ATCC 24925 / CBS 8224 / DSM 1558 / NBRC 9311 / NRRL Y-6157 / RJB 2259-6 / UBC 559-6) TaxID=578456 RepID=UPI00032C7C7C|nr:uncharacterized protein TREMEDRAFT_74679 [Tremella mesenterica DSM 1558]EIW66764.1 hypothetical protein TREMEDRAFT_74679 [Tremella mesenterica DSM 1558]